MVDWFDYIVLQMIDWFGYIVLQMVDWFQRGRFLNNCFHRVIRVNSITTMAAIIDLILASRTQTW